MGEVFRGIGPNFSKRPKNNLYRAGGAEILQIGHFTGFGFDRGKS
jgi:hypothetical protein